MNKIFPADTNFADGFVINIDKPYGWTSTDVVRKIKFLLQRNGFKKLKVGHAGTLDPLATGVLLVCTGKATKMVTELQAEQKEYIAQIELGGSTVSGDLEHEVDTSYPTAHITRQALDEVLASLTGERLQTPPVYSAKKIDGQRAYEYAREGEAVEMRRALITIYSMEVIDFQLPSLTLKVVCSKGTYIRSLAMEIGEALGSGAHLSGLRRTRSGNYLVEDSYTPEQIAESFALRETK